MPAGRLCAFRPERIRRRCRLCWPRCAERHDRLSRRVEGLGGDAPNLRTAPPLRRRWLRASAACSISTQRSIWGGRPIRAKTYVSVLHAMLSVGLAAVRGLLTEEVSEAEFDVAHPQYTLSQSSSQPAQSRPSLLPPWRCSAVDRAGFTVALGTWWTREGSTLINAPSATTTAPA